MPASAAELEKAVLAALEPLVGKLSSDPAATRRHYPQISLGRTAIHDWSSGAETGEHLLTLHVWSKQAGDEETTRLAETIRSRLAEGLDLGAGVSARLRLEFEETRYETQFSAHHGLLRFRAWIEECVPCDGQQLS